jgi:flagellar hook-length control protein FliK
VTAAKQQSGASIDQQIQQDIQAVQVSMVPKLSAMPATSTPAITEVKPSEPHTEAVTGMTEPTLDPVVVSTTEKEMSQDYLGRDESDLLLKADDKIDSTAIASVAFDKVLNSVEPATIAKEVAPEQRSDPYAVARQVMDGMSLSTDRLKSSQVIITLKPEHLGEVTVKINVDGDKVTAAFHAASSEVRAILESSLPQLRQELSQQGWKFDSDGVFAGMKEFMANQQQQQSQAQEQQLQQFHQRSHRDMYDDTTAFTNTGRLQVMTAAAVDYRI